VQLAADAFQVIDGIFLAVRSDQELPHKNLPPETLVGICQIVIVAFDSSSWRIYSVNASVLEAVKNAFPACEPAHTPGSDDPWPG
jgi:hypothetical protein